MKKQLESNQNNFLKILVVDDEINSLKILKMILKSHGFKADTFTNFKEAFKSLISNEGEYEMIITDVEIKNQHGLRFIEKIKEFRLKIPVIAVIGYGDKNTLIEVIKKGCNDFIEKPIDEEFLVKRIKKLKIDFQENEEMHKGGEVNE